MKNQEEKRLPDKLADGLSGIMIIICVIIFAVMVFAVSYGVIGRYIPFIKNPRWTQELAILCMVWLCFLGSGYGIKEGLHVRSNILCRKNWLPDFTAVPMYCWRQSISCGSSMEPSFWS